MSVAQSAIVSVWFKGKELNLAMGLNISIARLASVANGIIVPKLYESKGLGFSLLFGFFVCIFSSVSAIGIYFLDNKAIKNDKEAKKATISEDEKFKISDIKKFKLPFWLLTGSCILTYMCVFPYI